MTRTLLALVLVALIAAPCLAAEAKPKPDTTATTKKPPTVSKPRFNPAAERIKFLKAAGVDGELTKAEFTADQGKAGGFVRKTDTWTAISKYDKANPKKNGTIDWFEAAAYRRSATIKSATVTILGTTDPATPGGRNPRGGDRGRGGPGGRGGFRPSEEALEKFDANKNGRLDRDEMGAYFRQRMIDRYDTSGDGKIDDNERAAARAAWEKRRAEQREQMYIRRFDKNGDGKLTTDAEKAAYAAQLEEDKTRDAERQKRRAEFMEKYDLDKSGNIDTDKEREAIRTGMRARMEERRKEMEKRYDTDGTPGLSEAETAKMREDMRRRFGGRGRGGRGGGMFGGRGGPGGRPGVRNRGPGGGNGTN